MNNFQTAQQGCISIRDRDLKLENFKTGRRSVETVCQRGQNSKCDDKYGNKAQSAGEFYERLLIPQYAAEFSFTVIPQLIF